MKYFIDSEFNGFGGLHLSMALVSETGVGMYWLADDYVERATDPWVKENIVPILWSAPVTPRNLSNVAEDLYAVLAPDPDPIIIADWPADIQYFCDCLMTGSGHMIRLTAIKFEIQRMDIKPWFSANPQGVQHNAWWDACAIRETYLQNFSEAALDAHNGTRYCATCGTKEGDPHEYRHMPRWVPYGALRASVKTEIGRRG